MTSHTWPIVPRGSLASPRGYPPLYALMILSHRLLRYAAPFLHVATLALNLALLGEGPLYAVTLAAQAALLLAAALPVRARAALVARYYVLTNASVALGLLDWLRHGTPAHWAPPEGTR